MTTPRLDILKIEAHHCYRCGNPFTNAKGKKRTSHHAIPAFLKPQRNVEIPICDDCHKDINKFTVQSLPKFDAMQNLIDNLKSAIAKWEKVISNYDQKEEDNVE